MGWRVGVGGGTMHINETSRTIGAITQQYLYLKGMEYLKSVPTLYVLHWIKD